MIDRDQHLHRPVDQDASHQAVDRQWREISEHLLGAEGDRQVVVVEHLLRAAIEETPEAQQHMLQAMATIGDGIGRIDESPAQHGAHRRGMVEVLGTDGEIVAVTKERGPPAPVPRALPVFERLAALRMNQLIGPQIRHQPGRPIGLEMIQGRRRKQSAEYMIDEQIVLNSPALPIAGRHGEQFADPRLVCLVALGAADIRPTAHAVSPDLPQFVDARVFPGLPAIVADEHRLARPLDGLLRRQHDRRRGTIVTWPDQLIARQGRRQRDGDRIPLGKRLAGDDKARRGKPQAVAACRHGPLVDIAGNPVARIIGLDLAHKKTALLERPQAHGRLLRQDIG